MSVALGKAVEVEVVEARKDGSGVVLVPILPVCEIDLSRTAGGGKGKVTISTAELDEIVANFAEFGAPVPVGFLGHDEDRSGPQPAFVEKVKRKGEMLWAEIELTAWGFMMVVSERAFRAFSVEIAKNLKTATREFSGWVLTGGIFTNRPATDVHFKIAAEGEASSDATATASVTIRPQVEEELTMPEDKTSAKQADPKDHVSLTFHQAKLSETKAELEAARASNVQLQAWLDSSKEENSKNKADAVALSEKVETLTIERDSEHAKAARLEVQHREAVAARKIIETTLNETSEKLAESRNAQLAVEVSKIVTDAVAAGVPPAIFDGWESTPAEWMLGKYASLEAFKDTVGAIQGVGVKLGTAPQKSGHDPAKAAEPKEEIDPKDQAVLDRLGLSVNYDGVTTLAEAKARRKAAIEAAKE